MAETYSAGIVTAYGAAVRGGYTGTYEQFCAEQAQFGANAAKVAQDRAAVEAATQTFTTVTVPGAVQAVQQTGATQVQAVESASETEQQQIALAGAAQETRVTQAGDDQVDAVEEAGATQVGNVNTAGTTQVGAVNTAGATQVQAVEDKGQEVIGSIPADYTDLTDDVADLKSAITEKLALKQPINLTHSDSDWTSGAYVDNGSGAITSISGLSYSAKMPVNVGDVIRLYDLYGGTFAQRQIRSVAAYDANDTFVRTSDSLGWKVNSYTVPEGVAYIILSAPTASNYMVVANTTVTAYEAWFEPYYIATYDFVSNALENSELSTDNLKNGFACALPKTKFRQTVGIPCTWYKSSMVTPSSIYAYVNAGYSLTTNGDETFSYNTSNADATNNGYVWYEYDPFMNLLYKFDNNTGYGAPTVVKALNLSDCSLLAIGDSTVDQDTMTAKLLSYFTENGHTITLLGTLGSQSDPLNKNEGRAGWTTANYLANTTKNGYTNPFWNPTAEKFDFSYYMAQQGYSGVDFVVIQLGINDLYPTDPRGIFTPNYSAIWANIRTMIDSIHEYNTATKIIINLPTTPNSNPEAHLTSEAIYQNFVINYNEYALNAMLSISENYVRASYCHLILDPATEIRDNVHPTVAGYEKMALEVINQINCWQNGV